MLTFLIWNKTNSDFKIERRARSYKLRFLPGRTKSCRAGSEGQQSGYNGTRSYFYWTGIMGNYKCFTPVLQETVMGQLEYDARSGS